VFDIDYRPVLWGLTERDMGENRFVAHPDVTTQLQRILPLCDLVVGTEEEVHILGGSINTIAALSAIREHTDALIVLKRGPLGCSAYSGAIPDTLDEGVVGDGFEVEVFNVLGAGDAFMGGFLRGWLRDEPLGTCCSYANAAGAIVVSRHGCAPAMPTWPELEMFLSATERPAALRDNVELEHMHRVTTRAQTYDEITVFAFDHRSQFEDMARRVDVGFERISAFKALALRALDRFANGDARFGVIIDGRHGMRALEDAADYPYWVARPIELPGSRPLEFECSPDVATELDTWPTNQVVKCLAFYHPDDEPELLERQQRQLLRLWDACRKTGHELLMEIIVSKHGSVTSDTVARAIRQIYELGIKPDWWKLEASTDPKAWRAVENAIRENDPWCRGVVLLGLAAPEADLIRAFDAVAEIDVVKGFAVGRTIFSDVAERWFKNDISNDEAVEAMAGNLSNLVNAWRAMRKQTEPA